MGPAIFRARIAPSRIPSQPVHGQRFPTFQTSRRISGTGSMTGALIPTGTWTALPDVPNQSENFGYGINDRGVAVGSALGVPWIWDPTTLSYYFLSVPGADPYSAFPIGLNDKGQVVGYSAGASYAQNGFIEEGGAYTTLDVPGAANTLLLDINNRGTIVGTWGNAAGTYQGFLMTSAGQFVNVD